MGMGVPTPIFTTGNKWFVLWSPYAAACKHALLHVRTVTPYAGHRQATCTTTVSGKGYKTLTAQDALRAKAQKNTRKSTTVGVVADALPPPSDSPNLVAAVFPDFDDDEEVCFSDGSDNSLPSIPSP